jgi:PmbA protein
MSAVSSNQNGTAYDSDLLDIVDRVVAMARPGESIEAFANRSTDTSVRVYQGDIENLEQSESAGIGVRIIVGGRTGFAAAGTLDPSVIAELVADARDNLGYASPDPHGFLAEPDGVDPVTLDVWRPELADVATQAKIDLALKLERLTLAADKRLRIDSADYGDGLSEMAIATSTGIRRAARESGASVSVSAMADERGETQTGFGFAVGRTLDSLDLEAAARDCAMRTTRLLGAVKPQSGATTVVLDPFVTAQFLGIMSSTLNGEAVAKGRSMFANRLGEHVAAPMFTLIDDPTDPDAFTATEIDGEGLASRRNELIVDGRLDRFVYSTYSARLAGTVSTGSAVRGGYGGLPGTGCRALSLVPGVQSQETMIESIDDGVLIQAVSGMHSGVNPVSGDFSTGASGVRIRNGRLAEPIKEFTIASTLPRMLLGVLAIGADVTRLPMMATGVSLVIGDVMVSGA